MGPLGNSLTLSRLEQMLRQLLRGDSAAPDRQSQLGCLAFLFEHIYGNQEVCRSRIERLLNLCTSFGSDYGEGPVELLRVPARINVLGEHIDYVSYIPTASLTLGSREHDMVLMFRPTDSRVIRGTSTLRGSGPISIELAEAPPSGGSSNWESYLYSRAAPPPHWGNYVKGAAFYASMRFGGRIRRGYDFAVDSTIPPAGGASSSSALTVLAGAAIRDANGVRYQPSELARDSARAEWFIGTRGGSMDHTTMCVARRMHAVHISYAEDRFDLVPARSHKVHWVTFYSHPANKGNELMLEYNERAAVSRILIPALIAENGAAWDNAVAAFGLGSSTALDELERLAGTLPESIGFAELQRKDPDTFAACVRAFPVLVDARRAERIRVRDRALHHLGEVRRVAAAAVALRAPGEDDDGGERVLQTIGALLSQSHESLRNLYGVSTPAVEELVSLLASDPNVYGARLMGGGFGGNVLALTSGERSSQVIERVQELFYGRHGRDSRAEHAVMVSTPGDGLSRFDCAEAVRSAVSHLNSGVRFSGTEREAVSGLLDSIDVKDSEIWPIVVAAGKGARARASGIQVPKPLVPVAGKPAVVRVLEAVYACRFTLRPPVVIASPETEPGLRQLLQDREAQFVVQPKPLGTGDAVLRAADLMRDFEGRALVIWGTQPVIRPETVRRSLVLAALYPEYEMILPTAVVEEPYAPLLRDVTGAVCASRETHLEQARTLDRGETNIGLFIAWSASMYEALSNLRSTFWREREGSYDRPGGELGFPNELITLLSRRAYGVLASPIADAREERGVKTLQDVAACETYIRQLSSGSQS